MIFADILTI